jgi:putative tricarboxylic transport membrane protein
MKSHRFGFDFALGGITVIVGIICLIESKRLFPLRNSFLSGDHALLGLTGTAMIILGLLLLFVTKPKSIKVVFPEKPVMIRLMTILGILSVYTFCINYLGYVIPTVLFGIPLFRLFGGYKWFLSVATSIICTAGLYALFIFGLGMSFPRGLFF